MSTKAHEELPVGVYRDDKNAVAMTGITGSPSLKSTKGTPTADDPRFGKRDRLKLHTKSVTGTTKVDGWTVEERMITHCPVTGRLLEPHERYMMPTVVGVSGKSRRHGGGRFAKRHKARGPRANYGGPIMLGTATRIVGKVYKEMVDGAGDRRHEKSREKPKDGSAKGLKGKLREDYHDPKHRYNVGRDAIDYEERCRPFVKVEPKGKPLSERERDVVFGCNGTGWKVTDSRFVSRTKAYAITLSNGRLSKVVEIRADGMKEAIRDVCRIHKATL